MIAIKVPDGNGGKWALKKKFTFAAVTFIMAAIVVFKGIGIAKTMTDIVLLLGEFTTFSGFLLGLVFAADITDKKLNGGSYNPPIPPKE